VNKDDPDSIPNSIRSRLILEGKPLLVSEISLLFPNVSRTSINRALTKLKERGHAEFLGREVGWRSTPKT
jgi:DNA-binding GntR family transcriptional regulator